MRSYQCCRRPRSPRATGVVPAARTLTPSRFCADLFRSRARSQLRAVCSFDSLNLAAPIPQSDQPVRVTTHADPGAGHPQRSRERPHCLGPDGTGKPRLSSFRRLSACRSVTAKGKGLASYPHADPGTWRTRSPKRSATTASSCACARRILGRHAPYFEQQRLLSHPWTSSSPRRAA